MTKGSEANMQKAPDLPELKPAARVIRRKGSDIGHSRKYPTMAKQSKRLGHICERTHNLTQYYQPPIYLRRPRVHQSHNTNKQILPERR